jgi:hypothetical protein
MCFSASASFTSSAVLAVTTVASFATARNTPQRVLAGIPLVFSIQQFTEGVLWMSLLHPAWARWEGVTTYVFQVFAEVFWPVYIPFCMLLFEQAGSKRTVMSILMWCGILLAAYTGYSFFQYPVHAFAEKHHIRYETDFPLTKEWYYGLLYFMPTVICPLMSNKRILRLLGYLFFVSYVVARLLFHYYEISVWCFFGAIISIIVLFMLRSKRMGV